MSLQTQINEFVNELLSGYEPQLVRAHKVIHDVVWGTNLFHPHEIALINSPILQRLRHIRQTGLTYLTFPTTNHTRFEHVLGMSVVVSRFVQKLNEKLFAAPGLGVEPVETHPRQGDLAELRLAALLHDCGHGVLSHVSEEIYRWYPEIQKLKMQGEFAHAKPSEILSYLIVKSDAFQDFYRRDIATPYEVSIDIERVADLILGKAEPERRFLANIINGPLDADKIDYISRDSLSSGVSTPIDIDRLFNELVIHTMPDGTKTLVISSILPLERLLFSKVLLFASLYHHQKVKASDCMVHGLFEYVRENGSNFRGLTFGATVDYLRLTDTDLLTPRVSESDTFIRTTLRSLANRVLLKRCLIIRRDTVDNYDEHVPYFLNRMAQSPWEVRVFRQQILDRLPKDLRCSIHELWLCLPEQPSLREASQTLASLPGEETPVKVNDVFPMEGWLRAFSDNKWSGYIFGPSRLQDEICGAAWDVLTEQGFKLNHKAAAYARAAQPHKPVYQGTGDQKTNRLGRPDAVPPLEGTSRAAGVRKETAGGTGITERPQLMPMLDAEEILNTMPLLSRYTRDVTGEPLKPFRFIFVLHFLQDLVGLMKAYRSAGLQPSKAWILYKDYLYPARDQIADHLKKQGFQVRRLSEYKTVVEEAVSACRSEDTRLIVVEDGGYIVPELHALVSDPSSICIGAVEQTTRGIRNDSALTGLKIPVLSVAQANIKLNHESSEVAKTVVKNIKTLLSNEIFSGRRGLVISYGSIGSRIAHELKDSEKMLTAVFDQDMDRLTQARTAGFETFKTLAEAISKRFLIVGATGETVIRADEILAMEHRTKLVSASSDQREIGVVELEKLSEEKKRISNIGTQYRLTANKNEIVLLADGFPVNFWNAESMPNRISDLVLTPIFLCTIKLTDLSSQLPSGIRKDEVDALIKDKRVIELFYAQQFNE